MLPYCAGNSVKGERRNGAFVIIQAARNRLAKPSTAERQPVWKSKGEGRKKEKHILKRTLYES